MKTTHLLSLLLALGLFLGTALTAYTVEPLDTPNMTDTPSSLRAGGTERELFELPSLDLGNEPIEPRDGPVGALADLSVPPAVQSSTGDWQIECVDCPKQFSYMNDRSLRLDSNNHPHIAYGGDHLYYAWYDGMQWHYETVDDLPGVGSYASLALNSADQPRISYYDETNDELKYAWYNGTSWHIETLDSVGVYGGYTLLALDESDQPHIIYYDGIYFQLKYAWHNGTAWHIETASIDCNMYASLALDGMGQPHISCHTGRDLGYAWRDGVTWHFEMVPYDLSVAVHTSLALDDADRPHISYVSYDTTHQDIVHTWYDGMAWHSEVVNSDGGWYTSLALDEAGRPHISYSTPSNGLKYVWYDGTSWRIEVVMESASTAFNRHTSLALDGLGRPHISYEDTSDYLMYAWYNGVTWQAERVDSSRIVWDTSLALDGAALPHISYCLQYNVGAAFSDMYGELGYAWHNGTMWRYEIVDKATGMCWYNSLALVLDGADRPHISYYDKVNYDLKYAWYDGVIWHIETVDTDLGFFDDDVSLVLDEADRPHIIYNGGGLKYAWYDGTVWQIETVDWGVYDSDISLALDGLGHPHISYRDGGLKYAWYDGTVWRIETVKNSAEGCRSTSLALDGFGHPHISYMSNGLEYAWRDGTGWHIETVDSEGDADWYKENTSLALDGLGRPRISYQGNGLKYAWYDGISWHIETVDDSPGVGSYVSLEMDGVGRTHISYHDSINGDLKYARQTFFLSPGYTSNDRLYNNDAFIHTLTLGGLGQNIRLLDPLPSTLHYVPGSITGTVTPAAVYSPTVRTIVWEGTLPTDTVPVVQFQVMPHITSTGALSTPLSIANTAWLTDTESSRVVSATTNIAVMPKPLFLDKQAAPRDNVHNGDTLTYTLTFSGSGQTARLWDPLPVSVRYITASITSSITPAAVYSPTAHAILWEGTLPTDTVQVIGFQVTPGIEGTGSLSLSLPIVNTAWLTVTTGVESGRSISDKVIVNAYHTYLPLVVRNYDRNRLTHHPANDLQPASSPNGESVVFISDRDGGTDVFHIPSEGGTATNLTQTPDAEDTPVFAPDGSAIAFASNRTGDWDIYLMDPDGSNVRVAVGEPGSDEVHPSFTPDGGGLAFSSNRADGNWDVYTATLGSDAWVRLTSHTSVDRFPSFSADGAKIVFRSGRDGNSEIYVMDADGSNLRRVTNDVAFDGYPTFTPDGGEVMFISTRSGESNVYVVNLADGELRTLAQRPGWRMDTPRLSRDGRTVVYAGGPAGQAFDIYKREFDGPLLSSGQ